MTETRNERELGKINEKLANIEKTLDVLSSALSLLTALEVRVAATAAELDSLKKSKPTFSTVAATAATVIALMLLLNPLVTVMVKANTEISDNTYDTQDKNTYQILDN